VPGEAVPDHVGRDVVPFLAVRDSRAPVTAAVNGICQAGGLLIAVMADIAVASDRATFGVPPTGSCGRLPRRAPTPFSTTSSRPPPTPGSTSRALATSGIPKPTT